MSDSPLRILLITGAYPPIRCGVGRYTMMLASKLAEAGQTVGVMSCGPETSDERPDGIEFLSAPERYQRKPLDLIRKARAWQPDVIHVQHPTILPSMMWTLGWLTLGLRRKRVAPCVVTLHEPVAAPVPSMFALLIGAKRFVIAKPHAIDRHPWWARKLIGRKPVDWVQNASMLPHVALDDAQRQQIRQRYGVGARKMLVSLGFLTPANATEWLVDIADPDQHHIVLAGQVPGGFVEHQRKIDNLFTGPWADHVTRTGFVPEQEAAELLAAADAVVLPFRDGGGNWNTSLHAALEHGSFVLTTSADEIGYDPRRNIYRARPGDLEAMRDALGRYAGTRIDQPQLDWTWTNIVNKHLDIYRGAGEQGE